MKKILLIFILLALFTVQAQAAWERQTLGPDVIIESLTLNPYPVEPGRTFALTIKVRNSDLKRTIASPRFTVQESYPFTLQTKPKVQVLTSLIPNEETLVSFKIKVDDNVATDVYDLTIEYQEGAGPTYLSNPIKIDIRSSGIELSVASVTTIPEEIYPGDEAQLKLVLKNTLPVLMKNIDLNFDFSSLTTPFTPLGTTTQRTLTTLNKGSQTELLFNIAVDAEAEPKVYKVPLTINYEDEFGNPYTINTLTGIKVSTLPEIQLDIEKTEVRQAFVPGNIILKISNTGLADLKFLTIKLQPSKDYNILSSPQNYIGSLESDDYETAEFKILARSRQKNLPLKLLLTYRDSFNKEYETEETIYLQNYLGFKLSSFGFNSLFKIIFYIIVISFIYLSLREWRRTKSLPLALKIALKIILIKIKRIIKSIRPKTLKKAIKTTIKFLKEP